MVPALVFVIYVLLRSTIYSHKAWDYCLSPINGQSRASNVVINDGSHASFFHNQSLGIGLKLTEKR